MIILICAFIITASLYAAVGFAGGSTYNAILMLVGTDYRVLPIVSLFCNLLVSAGGVWRFARAGYVDLQRIRPWIVASVPAAWLGGYIRVSESIFVGMMAVSLFLAGLRMILQQDSPRGMQKAWILNIYIAPPVIGFMLGFLAGMLGIGGGIFLAPVMYILRWDNGKKIAAACSVFILINSMAGIIGQAMKIGNSPIWVDVMSYWMLFPAVIFGGQIGSYTGAVRLNPKIVRIMTAILILYVATQLLWRWYGMVLPMA